MDPSSRASFGKGERSNGASAMSGNTGTRTVVVSHPAGLCLRGASSISQLARRFQSRIEIVKDGERAIATEALQVISLVAACGTQLVLEATGPDAEEALDALEELFADNFGLTDDSHSSTG
jgi:phosphotransferase system HPr (HPr) family protein